MCVWGGGREGDLSTLIPQSQSPFTQRHIGSVALSKVVRTPCHLTLTPPSQVVANVLDPHVTPYQFLSTVILNKCAIPEAGGIAIARAVMNSNQVGRRS